MRKLLASLLLFAACGDDGGKAIDASVPHADAAIDTAPADSSVDAFDDRRGPKTVSLTGGANALLWDNAASTLYLTDSTADTLLKFTDAGQIATVAALPAPVAPATASLGDMVQQGGGTILMTNFGFGTDGTIFKIPTAGASSRLTGLDATRRRIAMSKDSAGLLYDNYFTSAAGVQTGGVATVTLAMSVATEVEIAGAAQGLKKVVGLVATPTTVYVSDQTQKKIFKIAIPGNAFSELVTTPVLTSADLMIMMPNGDLLMGGGAMLQRITQAGVMTVLTFPNTAFEQIHGLAYDPTLKRLFIIDHSATVGTPDKLHIVPLDN